MKVVFTPAPLTPTPFPEGTDGSGALSVVLDLGAAFKQSEASDGTSDVTFAAVPVGTGTLTYGRMLPDGSGFLGTPFSTPVNVTAFADIAMPSGGTVKVLPD